MDSAGFSLTLGTAGPARDDTGAQAGDSEEPDYGLVRERLCPVVSDADPCLLSGKYRFVPPRPSPSVARVRVPRY